VKQTEPVVRIVVAQPSAIEAGDAFDTIHALKRLGPDVELEIVRDAGSCIVACREGAVDLVVVDHALVVHCERILKELRNDGPPVVVVNREESDEVALDMFRRGATDCVTLRPNAVEALPVVALEQIRRFRAARERGAAERRIRDLERYTENIIQNMNSALLVVDMDGRITFCNPPAGRILGEDASALRGRAVWNWFGDGSGKESLLATTINEGVSFKGAERIITRTDGTPVPIGISCSPFFDSAGEKIGAVAIFQDLTEVKQLQSQVLQTEKMASIGQLAAGVAHEINNPMGFIHANLFQMAEYLTDLRRVWDRVDDLERAIASGDLESVRRTAHEFTDLSKELDVSYLLSDLGKAIRESQEGSERIRHIVHDLRDFSHHDTGERVLADVNQCLESTATIVWPMMKQIVVLEKDCDPLEAILCYPMQIKQVFMNLLVNAYQSIEACVGESGETGKIWLRTRQRHDGVLVEVSDTGIGIPEDHIDRIFDPFFTTKKVGSGTGLGLSTSFNIVKRHGGTISVESKVGEGTTFGVFLPADGVGSARDGR
jgi:two-component system NtrC family sensor kinase